MNPGTIRNVNSNTVYLVTSINLDPMPLPAGLYAIHSAYCPTAALEVSGGLTSNGSPISIYKSDPNATNQKWMLEMGARGYKIKNSASGTYLSFGLQTGPGHFQLTGNANNPVEWQLYESHLGYEIRLAYNPDLVIDLFAWKTHNSAAVWLFERRGLANQQWILKPLQTSYASAVPAGQYIIKNFHTNTALDLTAGQALEGSIVTGNTISRQLTQTWILEPGTSGYKIKNAGSGMYLSFRDDQFPANDLVLSGNARPVEWDLVRGSQTYKFRLASNPEFSLDLQGANATPGTRAILWASHGDHSQQWDLMIP